MIILFLGDAQAEHLRRWSRMFADKGHAVHVLTWNATVLDGYTPVQVHVVEKTFSGGSLLCRLGNFVALLRKVKRIIRSISPDLIHAHSAEAYSWMAMFSGFRPYVASPWGDDVLIAAKKSSLVKLLTGLALKKANLVHCDGKNTMDAVKELGVNPGNIFLCAFGVDVKKFAPGAADPGFLMRHGLVGKKVVVSTRTLNPVHNVETVILSVRKVLEKIPDTVFLIVGPGRESDSLRGLSDKLGISSNVIFTGRVEESEMTNCLLAAQVYVSTSLSESGLAASTAEAMACGLPIINTNTGDISDWIVNGGYVIPIRSPEILSEKIVKLLLNDELRTRFGKENRAIIEERNNVYVEMDKMAAQYELLVHKHK